MTVANMLAYVQSGGDIMPFISRKKVLKHGIGCFLAFLVMSPLGFTYNTLTVIIQAFVLLLVTAYCLCCIIIASKPMTKKGGIAHAAFSSLAYCGAFLGLSMIAFERVHAPWYGFVYIVPVVIVALSLCTAHRKVEKNDFLPGSKKKVCSSRCSFLLFPVVGTLI